MNDMHSLAAPYVADALDDGEREDFDLHLPECDRCRNEVSQLRETMAEVGAFHEVAPPPMLRASILSAIARTPMLPAEEAEPTVPPEKLKPTLPAKEAEPATEVEPPSNVIAPRHGFGRPRRPVTTWLAAAAAVVAVALGGVTVWQQSQLQSIQSADAQRVELLAAPDLQVGHTSLAGGELTYLVSRDRGQALVTSDQLPDPGSDRSWQVWVVQDGETRSGALVDSGGRVQALVDGVSGGQALAITNEPRGGSPAPTTDNIQAVFEF